MVQLGIKEAAIRVFAEMYFFQYVAIVEIVYLGRCSDRQRVTPGIRLIITENDTVSTLASIR